MGLNLAKINQQKQRQRIKTPSAFKRLLRLTILLVSVVAIIGSVTFYGQHSQWCTGHTLSKMAKRSSTAIKPVRVENIHQQALKLHVTPDYSGGGGLADKPTMIKLAQSNQPEISRGHVAVPSFNISEPLFEGTSDHVLAVGVGINEPETTIGKGRLPIFGHNMGDYDAIWPFQPTKFSALQNMTANSILGHSIYVSDGQTVFEYRATNYVSGLPVAQLNAALDVPYNGQSEVQLIACLEDAAFWQEVKASNYTNFHADKRIVLTGTLISQQSFNSLDAKLKEQLQ
ncbi:class A sortase [Leuconostoc gelidum subsp. aenigmaticum]|uniref:sortase domain-bontaining protein n=1 Tax=Leuconostoc gelidum TaxID=1244 RepID=UPI001CC65178|nr:sortase [Leuconostoc gelidum]MBZ6008255.1 class A sortase [Leuconostoc gelidum subsp. aenigmaticum]